MRFLLDTHTFIWWILDDPRLSAKARDAMSNPENELYLSAASTWEIVLKAVADKISLPEEVPEFIEKQLRENSVGAPPISIPHCRHFRGFTRTLSTACLLHSRAMRI